MRKAIQKALQFSMTANLWEGVSQGLLACTAGTVETVADRVRGR